MLIQILKEAMYGAVQVVQVVRKQRVENQRLNIGIEGTAKMAYSGAEKKEHLRFEVLPIEPGKKMVKYAVINTTFRQEIGTIHFRGGWRQYVFRAHDGVDMSRGCNIEIGIFIDKIMDQWKDKLKKNRALKK